MKFLLRTTKGFRLKFFLLFLCIVGTAVTYSFFAEVIGRIVDVIFYVRNMHQFILLFLIYAGLYLLNQLFHSGLNYIWIKLRVSYVVSIKETCFRHLQKCSARCLSHMQTGDVINRMGSDADQFLELIHRNFLYAASDVLVLFFAIIYIGRIDILLGLIVVVTVPVIYYVTKILSKRLSHKYTSLLNKKGLISAWIYEIMSGFQEIRLLHAGESIRQKYLTKSKDIVQQEIEISYKELALERIGAALSFVSQMLIYTVSVLLIIDRKMTVGEFVACETYFALCITNFKKLNTRLIDVAKRKESVKRVKLLETPEEQDATYAVPHLIVKPDIEVKHVDFGYDEKMVFHDMSFQIHAGECVAIVGKSGIGKSTFANLLCGLYHPDKGEILLDGLNLESYTKESLRNQISIVSQNGVIFARSIRYNICFHDEKSDDEKIWKMLEQVELKEVISRFPEGLDTVIDSKNVDLSGGQSQRIMIARALYKNAKLLIMDEATSAVDGNVEGMINEQIRNKLTEQTVILISHRFSTICQADRILVIDDGHIIGDGSHEQLLQTCENYRQLYHASQKEMAGLE